MSEEKKLSGIETIKTASRGLRGTLKESLSDEITGSVREPDHALIKFHGMYEQDDRDLREERAEKKLDKLISFMIRMRIPGGFLTPEQWIAAHNIAGDYSTGTIKITTRQTIQLHGILKHDIKPTLQSFDKVKLDSISACGDVNRNVVCSSNPNESPLHKEIHALAGKISDLLLPQSRAYYEIWLDEEKISETTEPDPLYQDRYLPRKFKIGIGIPPNNDVDVLANDLGLIAIIEDERLLGFNIAVGGGLSATHGNVETYPRLATVIGFVAGEENLFKAIYEIVTIQRDFGNRSDRKLARLKYTFDRMGQEAFVAELEKRCGFEIEEAKPYKFTSRTDLFGWQQDKNKNWHYTLFIENGRVLDDENLAIKTALLEIAETGKGNFRFTSNQNLIISDIIEADKAFVKSLLNKYKLIEHTEAASGFRKNAMACVALPTCPLALAEAQRYFPELITKIENILEKYDLGEDEILTRMTGCPNGCARPYAAEIGFIGTAAGHYNLHIGGDREGTRINQKYKEHLDENGLLSEIDSLFGIYKTQRHEKETFGDFVMRENLIKNN
ncbi:MAG: assimilatory sulfite reductase (NADPH) hemoprotein subunit [Ferruginibacter sp.]